MRGLRQRLGGLHREPVQEIGRAVVAVLLQVVDAFGDRASDGDDLHRDDVGGGPALFGFAQVVRETQVRAARLAREVEARNLAPRIGGIVEDHVVAGARGRKEAVDHARREQRLAFREPFEAGQARCELFADERLPLRTLDVRAAPRRAGRGSSYRSTAQSSRTSTSRERTPQERRGLRDIGDVERAARRSCRCAARGFGLALTAAAQRDRFAASPLDELCPPLQG